MRYGTSTALPPDAVMKRAREFFGPGRHLGLPEIQGTHESVTFGSDAGSVTIRAVQLNGDTQVTILSREYDSWAEEFIRDLA